MRDSPPPQTAGSVNDDESKREQTRIKSLIDGCPGECVEEHAPDRICKETGRFTQKACKFAVLIWPDP
jgi:hypothetical protein